MRCTFVPAMKVHEFIDNPDTPLVLEGMGIFTPVSPANVRTFYYKGDPNIIPIYSKDASGFVVGNFFLLIVDVIIEDIPYTFITTHFTWTIGGETTDEQRIHLKKILGFLETVPGFVMAGDFNAPRGREIFQTLASKYKDNIPKEYTTSIDKNLHRAGDLQLMVDGLFTTPDYVATDVKLSDGVSDHMAVTAVVSKNI